jgi:hypothetical protein
MIETARVQKTNPGANPSESRIPVCQEIRVFFRRAVRPRVDTTVTMAVNVGSLASSGSKAILKSPKHDIIRHATKRYKRFW